MKELRFTGYISLSFIIYRNNKKKYLQKISFIAKKNKNWNKMKKIQKYLKPKEGGE